MYEDSAFGGENVMEQRSQCSGGALTTMIEAVDYGKWSR